jgi:hypothetical protein
MNRFYKFFLLGSIFSVTQLFVLKGEGNLEVSPVKDSVQTIKESFPTIDFKRIDQKYLSYKKLSDRSKTFRTAVYVLGAGAASGLIVYICFRLFGGDKNQAQASASNNNVQNLVSKIDHKFYKNLGFWDRCAYGFKQGLSTGFYYGASAIVVTSFLALQSSIFAGTKSKFFELWNGKHQEEILKIINLLKINFKQIHTMFDFVSGDFDADEIKNNYALFIEFAENLIALVTQMAQDNLQKDSAVQNSIFNLRDLLCARILAFSEELEEFLKEANGENKEIANKNKADSINLSFRNLGDQLGRFINLSYSTIYEA